MKARLDDEAGDTAAPLLLDCREDHEWACARIDGATHLPMGQTPARVDELPRDRPIIVYCHHGIRSLQVAAFLRRQGFTDSWSMAGGIEAWARRIDPRVPRY